MRSTTMTFAIFDSTGNLVASYQDEREAHRALAEIVHHEPQAADEVALLRFDEHGRAVGEALRGTAVVADAVA